MNKEQYVLELVRKGLTKEEIEILLKDKFPLEYLPAPTPSTEVTPQQALDRTIAIAKKINEKVDLNTAEHVIHNLTDLTTGDAIYSKVEAGKIYFMAVDRNKQYLMQGLCISKDASTATFVGYSWNTSVKHTNTVWATATKGSTSGDTLSFNGVNVDDLKGDDNALANVALVKSLIAAGGGSTGGGSTDSSDYVIKTITAETLSLSDGETDVNVWLKLSNYLNKNFISNNLPIQRMFVVNFDNTFLPKYVLLKYDGPFFADDNTTVTGAAISFIERDSYNVVALDIYNNAIENTTYSMVIPFNPSDWTDEYINKIKQRLGLSTTPTQTLQEYIDSLDWTGITLTTSDPNAVFTLNDLVGLPNLDSDITTTLSDHETITTSGNYDFVLDFSSNNETASKTLSVAVTIGTAPNDLAQTIEGLTWTGITYTTDATVAEDSLGMFDLINAPQIPDDVTIDSITHSSISASGDLTVSIHFSKGSQTYIKNIIVAVTINSGTQNPQDIITIKTTDYDNILSEFVASPSAPTDYFYGMSIIGLKNDIWNNLNPSSSYTPISKPFILNVKTDTIKNAKGNSQYDVIEELRNKMPIFNKSYPSSGQVDSQFITVHKNDNPMELVNGHAYKFYPDKEPEDLGVFTEVEDIKTLTITHSQYTGINTGYSASDWYGLDGYTLTDTTTQFKKLILDVVSSVTINKATTFYDDGFSNTIIVLSLHSDTFDLVAGHKYQFETGKDPVDLGTYDTSGGGSGGGGTTPGATLQDAIDALTWTGITAHLPSDGTLAANQLRYTDLVGAPTLPTGSSIQSITHNSKYDAGDLSVQINFIKGEDWATKTITVSVTIAAYVPKTFTFDSSNYNTITYGKRTEVSTTNNEMTLNNSTSNDNIVSDDTIILYCDTSGSVVAPSYEPSIYINYKQEATAPYEYNFPQGTIDETYNFVAGHKYQIRSGQAIVDLGAFNESHTLQEYIDGLDWTGITVTHTGAITENSITYSDLVVAPTLRSGVNVISIKNSAIASSQSTYITIDFSDGNKVATKYFSVSVTIIPGESSNPRITITESDYTSIDDDGTGPRFVGYTLSNTSTVFTEMIAYIKTNKTISHFTTFYDNGYDTVYSGGISSPTFNLVAGKTYKFVNGFDPVEVTT